MSDGQVFALREMASILQRWLDHQERARTSEGLPTNDDTALAAPPQWPSKSQLKTFINALLVVADDIGRLNSKLSDATREIAQLSLEVARRVSRDDAAYVVGALAHIASEANEAGRRLIFASDDLFIDGASEQAALDHRPQVADLGTNGSVVRR